MAKETSKPSRMINKRARELLSKIDSTDAHEILRILVEGDNTIAQKVFTIADDVLSDVDIESVACSIQFDLECIDVEELWDRLSSTRHGYLEPCEEASEMIEEVLGPHLDELKKYKALGKLQQGNIVCMGILKGLYEFEQESHTEFKDWAVDAPLEYFSMVLNDWKNQCNNKKELKRLAKFIETNCPRWHREEG